MLYLYFMSTTIPFPHRIKVRLYPKSRTGKIFHHATFVFMSITIPFPHRIKVRLYPNHVRATYLHFFSVIT